ASRSTSTASNTTHLPSGDGTGPPTRFSFIMSSKVNGRFAVVLAPGAGDWAKRVPVNAKQTVRIFQCIFFPPLSAQTPAEQAPVQIGRRDGVEPWVNAPLSDS